MSRRLHYDGMHVIIANLADAVLKTFNGKRWTESPQVRVLLHGAVPACFLFLCHLIYKALLACRYVQLSMPLDVSLTVVLAKGRGRVQLLSKRLSGRSLQPLLKA